MDSKKCEFASFAFSSIFKLLRGDNNFNEEINYTKKLLSSSIKPVLK